MCAFLFSLEELRKPHQRLRHSPCLRLSRESSRSREVYPPPTLAWVQSLGLNARKPLPVSPCLDDDDDPRDESEAKRRRRPTPRLFIICQRPVYTMSELQSRRGMYSRPFPVISEIGYGDVRSDLRNVRTRWIDRSAMRKVYRSLEHDRWRRSRKWSEFY